MQGTPPFIALELLIHSSSHRVAHDLESILYVLLFICTHLKGPMGEINDPPLYGSNKIHASAIRNWLAAGPVVNDLTNLGHLKHSHIFAYFDSLILQNISPYFLPLKKYIRDIRDALFPQPRDLSNGPEAVHSSATPHDIIKVFKAALLDENLINDAKAAINFKHKRSLPGDLIVAPNCWDAVKPDAFRSPKKPKLAPSVTRDVKLLRRGRRGA